MLLALFVENIIAVEAIGALLMPLMIFAAIVFAGLYIGPRRERSK